MKSILFVTQNDYKFQKFQDAIGKTHLKFKQLSIGTPEIQAENNRSIAEYSAQWVADRRKEAVICEDVGFYIEAYDGLPGPYLSQVEKWLKTTGFLKLMDGIENRKAYWEYAVAFCRPNKDPVSFRTIHTGNIALKAEGNDGWYADKIFIPDGESKTIAQLLDEKIYQRNHDHYDKLINYLESFFNK